LRVPKRTKQEYKLNGGEERKMRYSRLVLIVVGILVLLMGILGIVPDLDMGTEPSWHAALKIVIGLVAIAVGYMDRE